MRSPRNVRPQSQTLGQFKSRMAKDRSLEAMRRKGGGAQLRGINAIRTKEGLGPSKASGETQAASGLAMHQAYGRGTDVSFLKSDRQIEQEARMAAERDKARAPVSDSQKLSDKFN